MVVESILPNQVILLLVSFLSADNVLSDEINIGYIFESKKKIERSALWDTRYNAKWKVALLYSHASMHESIKVELQRKVQLCTNYILCLC